MIVSSLSVLCVEVLRVLVRKSERWGVHALTYMIYVDMRYLEEVDRDLGDSCSFVSFCHALVHCIAVVPRGGFFG